MKAFCAVVLALCAVSYAQDPKPIFDGRLSLKPTALSAAEQNLLKDRILPAARKAWQSRRECDPGTAAAAIDVAPGSFTRPKSDQRVILYTFCSVGHNMTLNGIAVVENGAVVAHVIYEGGNDRAIGALPDIDGNGLSEIVVATGGTNQGVTWDAIAILEWGGAAVAAIGHTQVRTDDCGVDENHCTIQASRISVKVGSAPAFFRELFVDSGDGAWRKSGARTAITLEKGKSEYVLLK